MPRLTWPAFRYLYPVAHLVVGVVPEAADASEATRQCLNEIAKLVYRAAKGQYTLTINRQGSTPEIHCAFAREIDAKKVAETVGARSSTCDPEWASLHWFEIDASLLKRTAAD